MKKSNFINGAIITTIGIVITKILGILYVIPFHELIGEKGGALYGYAYTIYLVFMSIATAGIPLAISKIVSEYQALGYYKVKLRVFSLGKRIALLLGFVSFVIIMIFAPLLASSVLGDVTGGNSIEDVSLVIRIIGMAILVVPILSVYRGYFEGHRFMSPPSISQIIEQIVRVSIIIVGSFIGVKVLHLSLTVVVCIALFGAFLGALVSYLYLVYKKNKNNWKFQSKIRDVNEPIVSDKVIIKKIFVYAFPLVCIDIFKYAYNYVDMVTVVKYLVGIANFSVGDSEAIYAMLSTWGAKFNMIVLAISTGVIVSLIPNLVESMIKNDKLGLHKKICQALEILLYFTIPITIGISFLAKPIWLLFYGKSLYGSSLLSYYIFVGLGICLFTAMITILQTLKEEKIVFISLFVGLLIKIFCNKYLLTIFYQMRFPAYYGVITASLIGYLISFIICLVYLKNKYQISFEKTIHVVVDIICGSILMFLCLFGLKQIIPISSSIRMVNIIYITIYGLIGFLVYYFYTNKVGVVKRIFGKGGLWSIVKSFYK